MGLGGIYEYVSIAVARFCTAHTDRLMPAVLTRDRIGVNGEGEVLMHACVRPPNPLRIGILTLVGFHPCPSS
jgi:hypothetical protein